MNLLDCLLLAVALAMDCFSIGITCGIIEKRFHASQALMMAFFFGLFQGFMPVAGWLISFSAYSYINSFSHWIAFGLLLAIGVKMIYEGISNKDERCFNPNRLRTILLLAVATSIDALAVGITFTCVGMKSFGDVLRPVSIIALGSFVFTLAGKEIGAIIGKRLNFNAEIIGGIILCLIGLKIVIGG